VIAPPLRGAGWFNGNGCCAPDSRHRNLLLAGDGRWVIPEAFDVDWVQLVDEKLYTGDGLQLSDYPGYGAKLYAVADGRVVSVQDDRPEAPLGGLRNPGIEKPADYGGNQVVIRIAPRKYAVYAHLIAKRIPVRVGQRVREGQVVGLLGNTGNSSAPHLHFGIHDSPAEATGTSLPFVIDRYRYEGSSELTDGADYPIAGAPHAERRTYPLLLSVATFR
jgi:murein DD-endopeptidase MepM/ murein hydrolase activator NlpD